MILEDRLAAGLGSADPWRGLNGRILDILDASARARGRAHHSAGGGNAAEFHRRDPSPESHFFSLSTGVIVAYCGGNQGLISCPPIIIQASPKIWMETYSTYLSRILLAIHCCGIQSIA